MNKGITLLFALSVGLGASAQTITTIAGNGTGGFNDDEGPATAVQFWSPSGVAVAGRGLYIADGQNHRVRTLTSAGITTIAGTDNSGYRGDGGPATDAQLNTPTGVAGDRFGNIYIADKYNNRVRKIDRNGIMQAFAGSGIQGFSGDGGLAINAKLNAPVALTADSIGNVYIADAGNSSIRLVTPEGKISTIAGNGKSGFKGDKGAATAAELNTPDGVAIDNSGNIYISDSWNYRIRKVTPDGNIMTIAGTGAAGFSGDGGMDTLAEVNLPTGIVADRKGNIYFADQGNNRIRRITTNGVIGTIAGTGNAAYTGDGGPATAAEFNTPTGLTTDEVYLYVADQQNNCVRKFNIPPVPQAIVKNKTIIPMKNDNPIKTNPIPPYGNSSPAQSSWNTPQPTSRPVQTGAYNRRKGG